MKKPGVDLRQGHAGKRGVNGQHHFISPRGRRIAGTKVRGNKAIGIAHASERDGKGNGVGRTTSEHRRAVERESAYAIESNNGKKIKQIDREMIGATRLRIA